MNGVAMIPVCHYSIDGNSITVTSGDLYYPTASQVFSFEGDIVIESVIAYGSYSGSGDNGSCTASGSNPPGFAWDCSNSYVSNMTWQATISCVVTASNVNHYCATTDSAAQSILAAKRAECETDSSKHYSGTVVAQENGDYCVEGECNAIHRGECPADSGGANMLPKRFSQRQFYEKDSQTCREPLAEAMRQRSGYYYNAKGQRLGSLTTGHPKVRTPFYASESRRGKAVEEPFNDGYRNNGSLRGFLAKLASNEDSCGVERGDYGTVEFDSENRPSYAVGITCPPKLRALYDFEPLPELDNEMCGTGMYRVDNWLLNLSLDTIPPQIFIVDTNFVFSNNEKLKQSSIDSIQKHEEGHKRDMKCIAQKFPAKKIMFNGCFCDEEFESLIRQEYYEAFLEYDDKIRAAEAVYHADSMYGHSGYPPEEEMDVCPDYIQ